MPPPRCTVINMRSGTPHRFPVSTAVGSQGDEIAAVIIELRQRHDRLGPSAWSFDIDLPQLIRPSAFKALRRGRC